MFFKQAQQVQVQPHLRRICDLTSPNFPRIDEYRGDSRQNRIIPILLTPWENEHANISETATALTKDLSDCGISVTLPGPFRVDEVAVGFWLPNVYENPFFFLGAARQTIPIGGGFWALGIESIRLLTNSEFEPLVDLAKKRLQRQLVETEPPSAFINH